MPRGGAYTRSVHWRRLLFDYVPREYNLSRAERAHVKSAVKKRYSTKSVIWVLGVVTAIPTLLGSCLIASFAAELLSADYGSAAGVAVVVTVLTCYPLTAWIYTHVYRKAAWVVIRDMGRDICPWCGYTLEAIDRKHRACPECGKARPALRRGSQVPPGGG